MTQGLQTPLGWGGPEPIEGIFTIGENAGAAFIVGTIAGFRMDDPDSDGFGFFTAGSVNEQLRLIEGVGDRDIGCAVLITDLLGGAGAVGTKVKGMIRGIAPAFVGLRATANAATIAGGAPLYAVAARHAMAHDAVGSEPPVAWLWDDDVTTVTQQSTTPGANCFTRQVWFDGTPKG